MKRFCIAIALIGLLAGQTAMAQSICPGASAGGTPCANACSNTIVNDDVPGSPNSGKFNVGGGNQGDGNDGFNNQGSFNVGNANLGDCSLGSGLNGGTCDPSNSPGQIVLRFCNVYPSDGKCQPGGYLPNFSQALIAQIQTVVASCNGGAPLSSPPPPPPSTTPPSGSPPSPAPPTVSPPGAAPPTPPAPLTPGSPGVPGSGIIIPAISDSKADLLTLLTLLSQHIDQEKATGRKMLRK